MNNVMLHVNNVCWLGGTMFNTLGWIEAWPEFTHVVWYIHGQEHPEMLKRLRDSGAKTKRIGRLAQSKVAKLDPAIIILKNTGGGHVEGEYPFDWLKRWPVVYSHHSPVWPLIDAHVDIFNSRHLCGKYDNCLDRINSIRFMGSLIDTERFAKADRPRSHDGHVHIGKLASDQKVKFPTSLLGIMESLERPNVHFDMVGGSKYWPDAGERIVRYQAPDFGSRSAEDFYASWDILLYQTTPNYTETWCRIVTEAMASGLAIVAENKGAIPEQIDHGVNGFLCDTTEEFVDCCEKLITNPEMRYLMGMEARKKACANYDLKNMRKLTEQIVMRTMLGYPVESEIRCGNDLS